MEEPGTITSDPPAGGCPCCQRRLDDLPKAARFCPKCGGELLAPAGNEPKMTLRERMEQVQALLCEHLGTGTPPPSLEHVHSLTLLGYANAMLQLGWRYEHGRGVARNDDEADRYYTKSARLGSVYARARLADKAVDVMDGTEVPVRAERVDPELASISDAVSLQ